MLNHSDHHAWSVYSFSWIDMCIAYICATQPIIICDPWMYVRTFDRSIFAYKRWKSFMYKSKMGNYNVTSNVLPYLNFSFRFFRFCLWRRKNSYQMITLFIWAYLFIHIDKMKRINIFLKCCLLQLIPRGSCCCLRSSQQCVSSIDLLNARNEREREHIHTRRIGSGFHLEHILI